MSDLPEPFRRVIAELEAADKRNAEDILQLRDDHEDRLDALQKQYEKMEDNQQAILQRLGEVPTKQDIRLAVAEGITDPLQKAYDSVPLHIANQLSRQRDETAVKSNSWLKMTAIVAAISVGVDIVLKFFHIQ